MLYVESWFSFDVTNVCLRKSFDTNQSIFAWMMIKGVCGSNVKFLLLPIKFEVHTVRYRPSIFSLDL